MKKYIKTLKNLLTRVPVYGSNVLSCDRHKLLKKTPSAVALYVPVVALYM